MSIIIFLIVLAVLIISHELGHFIVAKRCGVRVDEFGLGFPPRLFGWQKGETFYSLNLLPFGGFVRIFGENSEEGERSMLRQPKAKQAAILIAGVVCNLLLAWLFLSVGFLAGLPVSARNLPAGSIAASPAKLLVTMVQADSPAALAGLKAGDEIVTVTDQKNKPPADFTPATVSNFIATSNGKLNLQIKHADQPVQNISVTPEEGIVAGKKAIGIGLDQVVIARFSFFPALWQGLKLTAQITAATVTGLGGLIRGAFAGEPVLSNITGPVGLAGLVGDAAGLGWVYLLSFTAFISINLAVLNLLPFPALDGGRLLFLLIEKIKGSAIKPQIANALNLAGFALLLLLMAVVTYGDIRRLLF